MEFKDFKEGVSYRPLGTNNLAVQLLSSTRLDVQGQFHLFVLKGSVSIFGYEFLPSHPPLPVHSPKGHYSLLTIHTLTTTGIRSDDELHQNGITVPIDLEEIEGAVIVLIGLNNRWCDGVRKYCFGGESLVGTPPEGLNIDKIPQMNVMIPKIGFKFLSDLRADDKRIVGIPAEWNAILDAILRNGVSTPVSIATFGGKGTGKSTFNRWLVNQLLSKSGTPIVFIDLDIGQPELIPSGIVSIHQLSTPLIGPNFTHLRQPLRAFYLGTVNVADEPAAFQSAIRELAHYVETNEALKNHHVILNTMGFCTGIGITFAVETIRAFRPTSIVQIRAKDKRLCYPFLMTSHNVMNFRSQGVCRQPLRHRLYEFASVCETEGYSGGSISAKILREIVIGSYFAPEIGDNFLGTRPRILPISKLIFGSKSFNYSAAQILEIVNGSLVALCALPAAMMSNVVKGHPCNVLKLDKPTACLPVDFYGYAIVRGIDLEEKKLFVITPVEEAVLVNSVTCVLAAGTIGLPPLFLAATKSTASKAPQTFLNATSSRQFVPNRTSRSVLSNALL